MSREDYRLGIDLGSNTLGWAALKLKNPDAWEPCGLLAGGVIVFPDGRDPRKFEPFNVGRRTSRGQRKRLRGRRWRRDRLVEVLQDAGLIGAGADALQAVHYDRTPDGKTRARDPWTLRLEALERELIPIELAKVLLHLARHRGFRSGALGQADEKDNSPKEWRQREKELGMRMAADNRAWNPDQTLTAGGWYGLRRRDASEARPLPAARNRDNAGLVLPPTRALIAQEFDEIQRHQQHHLSPEQWDEARRYVLGQRDLRLQTDRVGLCEFEENQPRAYAALTTSAIFRIRQDLCNLRVEGFDRDGALVEPRPLTPDEWDILEPALRRCADMKWDQLRNCFKWPGTMHFNRETTRGGGLKKLKGDPTGCKLAAHSAFGESWWTLDESERDRIIETMLTLRGSPDKLVGIAVSQWRLSPDAAKRVVQIAQEELGISRVRLSLLAMEKIAPRLAPGRNYAAVCRELYGHHSDRGPKATRSRLPYYGEVLRDVVVGGTGNVADPPKSAAAGFPTSPSTSR